MARKKKEETQEVKPEIKEVKKKLDPHGWQYCVNKAKFTNTK